MLVDTTEGENRAKGGVNAKKRSGLQDVGYAVNEQGEAGEDDVMLPTGNLMISEQKPSMGGPDGSLASAGGDGDCGRPEADFPVNP